MNAIAGLFNIVPGVLWAAICAGLFGWGGINAYRVNSAQAEIAEIRADHAEQETDRVRELGRELTRMVGITNNLNEVYREQVDTIDRMSDRLRALGLRVTKADRDAAITAASAEAVRGYATTAADHFAACRDEYVDLGRGYARCAAAAQSLDSYASEVSGRPSRPTPPTPPAQP